MKAFFLLLLLLPSLVSAKIQYTINGTPVNVPEPANWIEKFWILPSGYIWSEIVPSAKAEENSKEVIKEYIREMAERYNVSSKQLIDLAECESQFDVRLWGDKGLSYGLFQFQKKTFGLFSVESGIQGEWKDWKAQSELAVWAWSRGLQKHWYWCFKNKILHEKWP